MVREKHIRYRVRSQGHDHVGRLSEAASIGSYPL
jgi:hypothetical protein